MNGQVNQQFDTHQFESRKKSHIEHALNQASQAHDLSGLDQVTLPHDALPEHDFNQVSLETSFLKKKLKTPFFISGMTAGHASAARVNARLAQACAKRGWIFGVGSQRRELDSQTPLIDTWSSLKSENCGLNLVGNLGLSQLIERMESGELKSLKKLVQNLNCDAFAIHLNALQEVMQPEGTPNFRGGLNAIKKAARVLGVPVILKETGCGFSEKTLRKIKLLPILAVDVSGLGGTHWGRIEGMRAQSSGDVTRAQASACFANWGVSTVDSVLAAKKILNPKTEIWASGGVRSGLDAAKLIAIGAHRVGFAKPALEAALLGDAELEQWMKQMEFELQTALFCSGFSNVKSMRGKV